MGTVHRSLPELAVTVLAGRPGSPVLVLGPSLGTGVERLWGAVADDLGWDFHVLGWDLPGHGRSPRANAPFELGYLATAVLRSLDGALRDGGSGAPYLYAGDSVGGAVGLQMALDHADHVAGLAVLCSAPRFGAPDAWTERAALVRSEGMAPVVASAPARWFGTRIRAEPTALSRAALADLAATDPGSYAHACEAVGRFDVSSRLGEVGTPLLAVAGADDVVTPPAGHQDLVARVRAGRLCVLRGVGHLAPLEDPARTAALLREHFSRVLTATGRADGRLPAGAADATS